MRWRSTCATLDPAPEQGRRQPAVRDRRGGAAAHDRGAGRASTLWVAMVQREVGERLAAAPGGGAYGAPSVLAQLACEVEVLRAIPRTVFFPVPNVDSVLVGHAPARRGPAPHDGARCAVSWRRPSRTGARRSRARWPSPAARAGRSREQVRAALVRARAAAGRARRAALAGGLPRARAGCWSCERACARWRRRRSTSGCSSGPPRAQRRPPRAGQRDAVDLAGRRAHARAGAARGADER